MINVVCNLYISEINGEEVVVGVRPILSVINHWNRKDLIVIQIEGKDYTISAEDLKTAIDNCTNTNH